MTPFKAIVLDFMGVCATARMATSFDDTDLDYVLDVSDEVINLVQSHRDIGRLVGLLTNNDRRQFSVNYDYIDLDKWFDVVVFSSDVDANKPDPKIYLEMFRRLELEPQECIYVDDLAHNVDAATSLGAHGEIAESPGDTARLLRSWLH